MNSVSTTGTSSAAHLNTNTANTRQNKVINKKNTYALRLLGETAMQYKSLPSKFKNVRIPSILGAPYHLAALYISSLRSFESRQQLKEIGLQLGYFCGKSSLETKDYKDILGEIPDVKLVELDLSAIAMFAFELAVLNAFIASLKPKNIFEIGTYEGRSTLNMYENADPGTNIITIDLPPGEERLSAGNPTGYLVRPLVEDGKIVQLYGNTLNFDFSPYFGRQDFVFVDAGHRYENVKNDSRIAAKLMRTSNSGCILWHDYGRFDGLTRAVDEFAREEKDLGQFFHIRGTTLACLRIGALSWLSVRSLCYECR